MQPEQPSLNEQLPGNNASRKKGLFLPLFLMLWPLGFFLVALLGYAIVNLLLPDQPIDGELLTQPHPAKAAINVVFFLAGAAAVVFGPITFIVGVVLLILRKSKPTDAQN